MFTSTHLLYEASIHEQFTLSQMYQNTSGACALRAPTFWQDPLRLRWNHKF